MPHHLHNYIRAHRRRLGLTQTDLAVILGQKSGSNVCKNERRRSEPNLRLAIAYSIILHVSVEQLFPGVYEKARSDLRSHIEASLQHLEKRPHTPSVRRRQQTISELLTSIYGASNKKEL